MERLNILKIETDVFTFYYIYIKTIGQYSIGTVLPKFTFYYIYIKTVGLATTAIGLTAFTFYYIYIKTGF